MKGRYVIMQKNSVWTKYNVDNNTMEIGNVTLNPNDMHFGFNVTMPGIVIFDILFASKLLDWQEGISFNQLCQRYLHKSSDKLRFTNCKTESYRAEAIWRIWNKVIVQIQQYDLSQALFHECKFAAVLQKINGVHLPVKKEVLNMRMESIATEYTYTITPLTNKAELVSYLKENKLYKVDPFTGKERLTHDFLLSLNNDQVNKYVTRAKLEAENKLILSYGDNDAGLLTKDYVLVNYKQFSDVSGRVHTRTPNAQGVSKKYLEPCISLDFKAQELYTYLMIYNIQFIYAFVEDSRESGNRDLYLYLYNKVMTNPVNKEVFASKRDQFKQIVNMMIRSAHFKDISYKINVPYEKMYDFLHTTYTILNLEQSQKNLMEYVQKTGRYFRCSITKRSQGDDTAMFFMQNRQRALYLWGARNQYNKDIAAGIVSKIGYTAIEDRELDKFTEITEKIRRSLVGKNVQATAQTLFKKAIRLIDSKGCLEYILLIIHDELLLKPDTPPEKVEIIKQCMEDSSMKYYDVPMMVDQKIIIAQ